MNGRPASKQKCVLLDGINLMVVDSPSDSRIGLRQKVVDLHPNRRCEFADFIRYTEADGFFAGKVNIMVRQISPEFVRKFT